MTLTLWKGANEILSGSPVGWRRGGGGGGSERLSKKILKIS